jgi:dihydroorotase-like cyclic amidohydrolase
VLDETGGFTHPIDILVEHGVVVALGQNLSPPPREFELEGDGLWLLPGVFDCHVHTGLSSYETLELLRTRGYATRWRPAMCPGRRCRSPSWPSARPGAIRTVS